MSVDFDIRRTTLADLPVVAPLFDAYRQFYAQPPDPALAERFIRDRLERNESVIFVASEAKSSNGLGFTQLYPAFSSVAARPIWILNDLFVAPAGRRRGIGCALLDAATDHARQTGAKRLILSTAETNKAAQALFESYGSRRDDQFWTYEFEL